MPDQPIDIYFWPTPNCWKVTIFCEEVGIPYKVIPTNILDGAQFTSAFSAINRFHKVPAIVDHDGPEDRPVTIVESAAILHYLSEKTGKLGGTSARHDLEILQWLLFQVGTVGPMLGQAHHFRTYSAQCIPYAIDRYTNEATNIYRVLDRRLGESEFLAGDYSIADIALFPWTVFYKRQGQKKEDYPHFARWYEAIKNRPAVRRGIDVGTDLRTEGLTAEQQRIVFGRRDVVDRPS